MLHERRHSQRCSDYSSNRIDTWRAFDFTTDHDIPFGEYELKEGIYGDETTLIMYDTGRHSCYPIK